jgi:class 3 adenylate cyclase
MESEALHTLRQRFFALVQQAVQRYAGTVQHFVDNACLAFFGAMVAQEDHARRRAGCVTPAGMPATSGHGAGP